VFENAELSLQQVKLLKDSENQKVRLYPKYFRVAFYVGENLKKVFSEINNKQFVYKKRPDVGLKGITDDIIAFLNEPATKECPVEPELIANKTTDIEPKPNQVLFQIAFVEPFFDDNKKRIQSATYFGTNLFISEQVFNGNASLKEQQKKKTFYTTAYKIPFVLTRFPIISERSIIVTPIENAADIIIGHSNRLIEHLQHNPPKQNQLQQVLQGIIMPMVN